MRQVHVSRRPVHVVVARHQVDALARDVEDPGELLRKVSGRGELILVGGVGEIARHDQMQMAAIELEDARSAGELAFEMPHQRLGVFAFDEAVHWLRPARTGPRAEVQIGEVNEHRQRRSRRCRRRFLVREGHHRDGGRAHALYGALCRRASAPR